MITPESTEMCDYCKDTRAIMHFWNTNKNCCSSAQCERLAHQEAAEKDIENRS